MVKKVVTDSLKCGRFNVAFRGLIDGVGFNLTLCTRRIKMVSTPKMRSDRRGFVAAIVLSVHSAGLQAQLAAPTEKLRPTPAQTEGPYYPIREPKDADFDLLQNGARQYAKGTPVWVEGRVLNTDGQPLKGGVIEIWQCDESGHYDHPADGAKNDPNFQGFGRVQLDAAGQFKFRTIKPASYIGRTPHIHAKIKLGKAELLTTQLYIQGDAGNQRDGIWRRLNELDRAAVTQPFVAVADGLRVSYLLVVQA
jgi:protocatechuate 3,4-dioxygenase, beta subunit